MDLVNGLTETDWMEWSEMLAPYARVNTKSVSTASQTNSDWQGDPSRTMSSSLPSNSSMLAFMSEKNARLFSALTTANEDLVRDQQRLKSALEDKAKLEIKLKTLENVSEVEKKKLSDLELECLIEKRKRISAETQVTKLTRKLEEFQKKLEALLGDVDALSRGNTIIGKGRLEDIWKAFETSMDTHRAKQTRLLADITRAKSNLQSIKNSLQSNNEAKKPEKSGLAPPSPLQSSSSEDGQDDVEVEVEVDPTSILQLHHHDGGEIDNAPDTEKSHLGHFCMCGRKFKSSSYLKGHIQYKTEEPKFFCPICPLRFVGFNYLKVHMKKIHRGQWPYPETAVGCRKCGDVLPTREKYNMHRRKRHNVGRRSLINKRKITSKKAASSSSSSSSHLKLEEVGKTNNGESHAISPRSFGTKNVCICGAKYLQRGSLISHIIQKTHEGYFPCSVCGRRFDGTGTLRRHVLSAHKYKLVACVGCRLCGKVFKSQSQLHSHRSTEHKVNAFGKLNFSRGGENRRNDNVSKPVKKIKQIKAKTKAKPKICKNHDGVQNNLHSFSGLKICAKKKKAMLQCLCGKKYSTPKLLNYHLKGMEKGKIFSCQFCHFKFYTLDTLKIHCRRQHKMKPLPSFGCRDCGHISPSFTQLLKHRWENHP